MNTSHYILLAEKEIMGPAITRLRTLFANTHLCGHNMDHHLRVWSNAKRITEALAHRGEEFTLREIKELMLATLFHDTGMINDTSEFHGYAGAELFLAFNEFSSFDIDRKKVALAIEKHDDKSYLQRDIVRRSLLTILSAADDMDAFGITGFLRYWEIYSLRKNNYHGIASDIMKNSFARINFFRETWNNLDEILSETERRYNILVNCCRAVEQQQYSKTVQLFINRALSLAAEEGHDLITAATTLLSGEFGSVRKIAAVKENESVSDLL